ncbi:DEAD/DEAH box helicase [Engelhardtia mirabilis]|uniref:Putative ATP-dependent helicase Lhr n=1 Tax=Engelhardtia mirabilis TaxID=2528011 RepID=A0A518BRP9_9BACT|nr:putative ATP-dependent helicase Lhr [Planctomycetes bacterium Pla133]QDV03977.1 putative ATP-dependent helicase Lhr [Planctomycetes bacterium Pla86]
MLPSVLARETRQAVLDYLRTTLSLADEDLERALFDFLDGPDGLFRGPFVDVRLPFLVSAELDDEDAPIDVRPPFPPFAHQLEAWERLSTKIYPQPRHTLVTTGTGSGKTECFLMPILDHCRRAVAKGEPGIKAIILYPMNALATDQARRLAKELWDRDDLDGVSAGLYVGGETDQKKPTREHLIGDRHTLRKDPPDILLTNYKMLDFLLLRPEDRGLWEQNTSDTLRYLVLDELHTYDGAQGSDVACLIRRLKERLSIERGRLCCVGTSATVGDGDSESRKSLVRFAEQLFGERMDPKAVVGEQRLSVDDLLGRRRHAATWPEADAADLAADRFDDGAAWIARQTELWFGERVDDPRDLGARLLEHGTLRALLEALGGRPAEWPELDARLVETLDGWGGLDAERRWLLVQSFLGLVSTARDPHNTASLRPFLTVQVQLWIRELRRLLREVTDAPSFAWADALPEDSGPGLRRFLPIGHCRECGASGFASTTREGTPVLSDDPADVGRDWVEHSRRARFLVPRPGEATGFGVERNTLEVAETDTGAADRRDGAAWLPVLISSEVTDGKRPKFRGRCPECDSDDALLILGSRAAALLGVATSQIFQSPFNDQRKLLAFCDSVQDASHRAGFLGARTFRFDLRAAIQGTLEARAEGEPPRLDAFARDVLEHWTKQEGASRAIASLWPADLRDRGEWARFHDANGEGAHADLAEHLVARLSWDLVLEFGHRARLGRTLERTGCSTVRLDPARFESCLDQLALDVTERGLGDGLFAELDRSALAHFLWGLFDRTRLRGGVMHPFLGAFAREGGGWFHLTRRRNPLISPFGKFSRLPRLLTDTKGGSDSTFDLVPGEGRHRTWFRDWAERALGLPADADSVRELYRFALDRALGAGLLVDTVQKRGGRAFGLKPDALELVRDPVTLACDTCRRTLAVDVPDSRLGRACPQYRCTGRLEPESALRRRSDPFGYYRRLFRSGRLSRVVAAEHTGLLDRKRREQLEDAFKADGDERPIDAPNLFVCTPTLEMGIDIGDLSATVLCSVPPAPANYLQRVGRAGRSTGNAFCATLVLSRPHDLYFRAEPQEMLAGEVLAPGCFLDAPHMLERQLTAHAMDAWALEASADVKLPKTLEALGDKPEESAFLQSFLAFHGERRGELTDRFVARFKEAMRDGDGLSDGTVRRIEELGRGTRLVERVATALRRSSDELRELASKQRKVRRRLAELESAPDAKEVEAERDELETTRRMLGRLKGELARKYPLAILADEGVLPNYAFPEAGVTLESVVAERPDGDGKPQYRSYEFVRPASSALRELAPFNTFYADGRHVRIDEIDVGGKNRSLLERWRLCASCHHSERVEDDAPPAGACPACRDLAWADQGRVRTLVRFRRSRSLANLAEVVTADDSDDRDEAFYETFGLIDVEQRHLHGAVAVEDLPFGVEYLVDLELRELNLGASGETNARGFPLAGEEFGGRGFEVCTECGKVRMGPGLDVRHAAYCSGGKTGNKERLETVFLYRELTSEALRLLVPAVVLDDQARRASFKAALALGFRRHFRGRPAHLVMREVEESLPGGAKRHFVVVFDAVPGGTGHLAGLWSGRKFMDVLAAARTALEACGFCNEHGTDGCYRCLFAYEDQGRLPLLSRATALEMLETILARAADLKPVNSLSEVSVAIRQDSELERLFDRALVAWAKRTEDVVLEDDPQRGEHRWRLTVGDCAWAVERQVRVLGDGRALHETVPDLVFRPADGNPEVSTIAVYLDGALWHVKPGKELGGIADDMRRRDGLRHGKGWSVWSLTWQDVQAFLDDDPACAPLPPLPSDSAANRRQAAARLGENELAQLVERGALAGLLAQLRDPNPIRWSRLSDAILIGWTAAGPNLGAAAAETIESSLEHDAGLPDLTPRAAAAPDRAFRRAAGDRWRGVFASIPTAGVASGDLSNARALLRLQDDAEARANPDFLPTWRAYLHATGWLQFMSGELRVVTTEQLDAAVVDPYTVNRGTASRAAEH